MYIKVAKRTKPLQKSGTGWRNQGLVRIVTAWHPSHVYICMIVTHVQIYSRYFVVWSYVHAIFCVQLSYICQFDFQIQAVEYAYNLTHTIVYHVINLDKAWSSYTVVIICCGPPFYAIINDNWSFHINSTGSISTPQLGSFSFIWLKCCVP